MINIRNIEEKTDEEVIDADNKLEIDDKKSASVADAHQPPKKKVQNNVDAQDQKGNTALMIAARDGDVKQVDALLLQDADPNKKNIWGVTPLIWAAYNGHTAVVQTLLKHKKTEKDIRSNNGCTALIDAAKKGHIEIVEHLVAQGANVDIQDKEGETALMIAARQANLRLVQVLLNAGANPNLRTNALRRTALMLSARCIWLPDSREIIQELINAGADPSISDYSGHDALYHIDNIPDVAKFIRRRMQSRNYILYLLSKGHALENLPAMMKNVQGRQELAIYAAQQGRFDLIIQLIDRKDKINFLAEESVANDIIAHLDNGTYSLPSTRLIILKKIKKLHPTLINRKLKQLEKRLKQDLQGNTHHTIINAIEEGDFSSLNVLINKNPSILNVKDGFGRTLLDIACYVWTTRLLYVWKNRHKRLFVPEAPIDFSEDIIQSHQQIFLYVLAKSDINLRTVHQQTILHHAVIQNAPLSFIALLLLNNANREARDEANKRPIDYFPTKGVDEEGNDDMIHHKNLLAQGLTYLVRPENTEILEEILKEILPTLNEPLKEECMTALLIEAVKIGNILLVRDLVVRKGANATGSNKALENAFILAAEKGQIEMVDIFLAAGVSVDFKDKKGDTALGNAAYRLGQTEMVRHLLANNANPNIQDRFKATPLIWAVSKEHHGAVRCLLKRDANPNIQDNVGDTPLTLASRLENVAIVKDLLAQGADPNIANHRGFSPLFLAAETGNREIAEALLAAGAHIDFQTKNGSSVLGRAAWNKKTAMVNYLLAHGADPNLTNISGQTALMDAVRIKNVEMVKAMLDHSADPTIKDENGKTARSMADLGEMTRLIFPVYNQRKARSFFSLFKTKIISPSTVLKVTRGNFFSLEHIVKATPKIIDMKDDKGESLLHHAYMRRLNSLGNEIKAAKEDKHGQKIFSLLLEKSNKANINAKNTEKQSLLHLAAMNKAPLTDFILLLLKGANPNDKDRLGNRAIDYIKQDQIHHRNLLEHGIQYLLDSKDQNWVEAIFKECPDDIVKYEALLRLRNAGCNWKYSKRVSVESKVEEQDRKIDVSEAFENRELKVPSSDAVPQALSVVSAEVKLQEEKRHVKPTLSEAIGFDRIYRDDMEQLNEDKKLDPVKKAILIGIYGVIQAFLTQINEKTCISPFSLSQNPRKKPEEVKLLLGLIKKINGVVTILDPNNPVDNKWSLKLLSFNSYINDRIDKIYGVLRMIEQNASVTSLGLQMRSS